MAKRKKSRTPAPPRRPAAPRSAAETARRRSRAAARRPGAEGSLRKKRDAGGHRPAEQDDPVRRRRRRNRRAGRRAARRLRPRRGGGTSTAHFDGPNVDFANLPGLMRKPPPWPKNTTELDARPKQSGVQILPQRGWSAAHPPAPGHLRRRQARHRPGSDRDQAQGAGTAEFAELHTHDTSGIVHLESDTRPGVLARAVLRRLGVLSREELRRQLCTPPSRSTVYVNGKKIPADSRSGQARPPGARRDRDRLRDAAVDDPVELQLARRLITLRSPGWRNWRYAADFKSAVPVKGA